jgi:hypothetical protein
MKKRMNYINKLNINSFTKVIFNMKRFLFLDVDGVLNTTNLKSSRILGHSKNGAILPINDALVNNLKYLYDKYDLNLVLSSTWREDAKTKRVITQVLLEKQMLLTGATPILSGNEGEEDVEVIRPREILSYVKKHIHPRDKWVAVDDLDLHLKKTHFVQTSDKQGLTTKPMDKIEKILGGR